MIVTSKKKHIFTRNIEGSKILIPQFDGKERHFDKWVELFEAYYHIRLCGGSLQKDECELPSKMKGAFDADEKMLY